MAEFAKLSKLWFPDLEESMKLDRLCCVISIFGREVDEKRAILKLCCVYFDELLKWTKCVIVLNWSHL
jgi:hypothetical protein